MSGRALPHGLLEHKLRKRWLSINNENIQNLKRFRKRQRGESGGRQAYGLGGRLGGGGWPGEGGPKTVGSESGEATSSGDSIVEQTVNQLSTSQESSFIAKGTESITAAIAAETASIASVMVADNSEGFSEVELTAIIDNLETAGPGDIGNILGLDIQSNDVGEYRDGLTNQE
jgi:hypothetical protein